jgi:hypothetical protein
MPDINVRKTVALTQTAGFVVAFVEFLLCILTVYGLFRNLHLFGASYLIWFILGIISVLIILIAIALLLYAIKKENARFLIPHISAQANTQKLALARFLIPSPDLPHRLAHHSGLGCGSAFAFRCLPGHSPPGWPRRLLHKRLWWAG